MVVKSSYCKKKLIKSKKLSRSYSKHLRTEAEELKLDEGSARLAELCGMKVELKG